MSRYRSNRSDEPIRIDRPAGPVTLPPASQADHLYDGEQQAIVDTASGSIDAEGLISTEAPLPYEDRLDASGRRQQVDAELHKIDDALGAQALLARVRADLTTVTERLDTSRAKRGARLTRRAAHAAVLDGEAEDGSGRNRTGPVPTSHSSLLWSLRTRLITIAVVILEAVALFGVMSWVFSTDDPSQVFQHPEMLATAGIGAITIIAPPIACGVISRGAFRNATHRLRDLAWMIGLFLAMIGGWLLVVWLLSQARASAFAGQGPVSLTETAPTTDQNLLWLFFIMFSGLGLFTMWHESRHNWHTDEVVKLNAELRRDDHTERSLSAEATELKHREELQRAVLNSVPMIWDHYAQVVVPARIEEQKRAYRHELVRRQGDPRFTEAIQLSRTLDARSGPAAITGQPDAPARS